MLTDQLSSLGLTQEETKTYLALLELGPTKVSYLARKIGKPRPTLYGFLKKLHEKGLITQSLEYGDFGTKVFIAEPPHKISQLFRQKIENLENQQKLFKTILPELEKTSATKFLSPKFQLYEGIDGLRHVLKDMLLYSDIETTAFWPIKSMVETLSPEFFRYHNKERIKNRIFTRALWPNTQTIDIKKHPYLGAGQEFQREIRIAPPEIDFPMGYWIYKNKTAFISSRAESFGFIIESRELTQMLLSQFELIWKISKPLVTNKEDTSLFLQELSRD